MLKVLLLTFVSISVLMCSAQDVSSSSPSPSQAVKEDPHRIVTDFNATGTDANKVQLSWRINGTAPEFFAIERSGNGQAFEIVGVLNKVKNQKQFYWTDDAPKNGRSYYRLRYSFREADSLYSPTVSATVTGEVTWKFYPNPVDHVLIIKSESPIDVQISDATGKPRIFQSRVQGIHTINVSSLEKGIYLIRFSNKLTNVMSQEKLIKN